MYRFRLPVWENAGFVILLLISKKLFSLLSVQRWLHEVVSTCQSWNHYTIKPSSFEWPGDGFLAGHNSSLGE